MIVHLPSRKGNMNLEDALTRFRDSCIKSLLRLVWASLSGWPIYPRQGDQKMIRKDLLFHKTRGLLDEFLAPMLERVDKPRQRFLG
jgi:hypothetical protein